MIEEERRREVSGRKSNVGEWDGAIKIGPFELKNRMVLAPMNETTSGVNGEATEQCIAYWGPGEGRRRNGDHRSHHGDENGLRVRLGRNLYCFHQGHQQALSLLTDRIHYFGAWPALK